MCGQYGWRSGCTIYLGTILFSLVFNGVCYFENKLIIRTEDYKTAYSSFININITIIVFAIFADFITKKELSHFAWPILVFLIWIGLMIASIVTISVSSNLKFPSDKEALKLLAKEAKNYVKSDKDPFINVHRTFECCGLNNYTDWKMHILPNSKPACNKSINALSCPPDVVQSCCINQMYCGHHIFSHYGININFDKKEVTYINQIIKGPSIDEIIYTRPCKEFVEEWSLHAYAHLRIFMSITVVFLVLIGITFVYYFWEDEINNLWGRLKAKYVRKKSKDESENIQIGTIRG